MQRRLTSGEGHAVQCEAASVTPISLQAMTALAVRAAILFSPDQVPHRLDLKPEVRQPIAAEFTFGIIREAVSKHDDILLDSHESSLQCLSAVQCSSTEYLVVMSVDIQVKYRLRRIMFFLLAHSISNHYSHYAVSVKLSGIGFYVGLSLSKIPSEIPL